MTLAGLFYTNFGRMGRRLTARDGLGGHLYWGPESKMII